MQGIIVIDGKEIKMKASALIPRIYRYKYGRDIIRDMAVLKKAYDKMAKLPDDATEDEKLEAQFSVTDLTIFENIAYCMAKHADESIPDTAEEWLEEFEIFSIYSVLPEILRLWNMSNITTSMPKKN